jgi:hypothetical protein
MSNGWQDNSVQFKEEENELRIGSESKEVKKVIMTQRVHYWRQRQGERQRQRQRRRLLFCWNRFFCKENRGLCFSVEGEDHFLNGMTGTDRLCV